MEIKHRLYPYPVLAGFNDDYQGVTFTTSVVPVKEGFDLKLVIKSDLTSPALGRLIKEEKAKFVYHLECSNTGFRTALITDKPELTYIVSKKEVRGKLQVSSFIGACQDIYGYTADEFNEDYQGCSFDIEAGCVLAAYNTTEIIVEKETEDLVNAPSIFSIVKNADPNAKQMLVDTENRKIVIKLPQEDYYQYKKLRVVPEYSSLLNSLTVFPALVYTLEKIQKTPSDNRFYFDEAPWFKALTKVLKKQFQLDIYSDDFTQANSYELAQQLIDNPISEAFSSLTRSIDDDSGEDA